jgi:hypothetical protein
MWPYKSKELGPVSGGFYGNQTLRLGTFDIRVLLLHRGSRQDEITCTLQKRLLLPTAATSTENLGKRSQQPDLDCTTLSYQWGSNNSNLHDIQCNTVCFRVTSNLYSALVHLRNPDSDITLWIDAICINQKNSEEKVDQIKRMGEIYSRSKCTIIWLGDGGFLSREAFRACSRMAHASRHQAGANPLPPRLWGPLSILQPFLIILLLRRSYFARIWVIQEVALSHKIEIACGSDRISWWDFTIGAAIILVSGLGSKSAAGIGNILVARALLPWTSQNGRDDPARIFQTLTQRGLPQAGDILAMAILFRRSHATDPVDKLFGLLALCEQIREGSTYGISPAYSPNDPDHRNRIYTGTARTILSSQNSLQLFSAVNRRPPNSFNILADFYGRIRSTGKQIQALPTWVPDWSDTGSMATPLSLMLAQNNTLDGDQEPEYDFNSFQQRSVIFALWAV